MEICYGTGYEVAYTERGREICHGTGYEVAYTKRDNEICCGTGYEVAYTLRKSYGGGGYSGGYSGVGSGGGFFGAIGTFFSYVGMFLLAILFAAIGAGLVNLFFVLFDWVFGEFVEDIPKIIIYLSCIVCGIVCFARRLGWEPPGFLSFIGKCLIAILGTMMGVALGHLIFIGLCSFFKGVWEHGPEVIIYSPYFICGGFGLFVGICMAIAIDDYI
jgi:hypothetical protein